LVGRDVSSVVEARFSDLMHADFSHADVLLASRGPTSCVANHSFVRAHDREKKFLQHFFCDARNPLDIAFDGDKFHLASRAGR
jgi:hypothetical protein